MFGIEIIYKNGKKDWVDPVTDEPIEKDGILSITNDCYTYEYSVVLLDKWFKYNLCTKCKYDLRTYDCTETKCLNPKHINQQEEIIV